MPFRRVSVFDILRNYYILINVVGVTRISGNEDMKGKFTRYFAIIEFATLFSYTILLLIGVVIVASGASRLVHLFNTGSDGAWVSVLTHADYSPSPPNRSKDKNYLILEDDKGPMGKFMESSDPALMTDLKAISFGVIDTNIDDFIYSINSLRYVSVLGFNPLRSPPYFC